MYLKLRLRLRLKLKLKLKLKLTLSDDFYCAVMLDETEIALRVEAEEVGSVGAVAVVRVPVVGVRRYVVALVDESSPAVVDAEAVYGIEVVFYKVYNLPYVVVPVAVWRDDVGEAKVDVNKLDVFGDGVDALVRIASEGCEMACGDKRHVVSSNLTVVVGPDVERIDFGRGIGRRLIVDSARIEIPQVCVRVEKWIGKIREVCGGFGV